MFSASKSDGTDEKETGALAVKPADEGKKERATCSVLSVPSSHFICVSLKHKGAGIKAPLPEREELVNIEQPT